jgi:hypothetical protein
MTRSIEPLPQRVVNFMLERVTASSRVEHLLALAAELTREERTSFFVELRALDRTIDRSTLARADKPHANSIAPSPPKEIVDKLSAFVRQHFGSWLGPVPTLADVSEARRDLWNGEAPTPARRSS